ncbi:MAG: TonB-dependent receptor [Bryobacterales bacterium]|nr:TonB-dependent receptor [Bryobacterales bacterium]
MDISREVAQLLCWGLLVAGAAQAQRTTANLYGVVHDTSGAVVPGVTVLLVNEETGARIQATSDERGEFLATFIPIGSYTLAAEANGFKPLRQTGLDLTSGQQVRYPITLEVGDVTEEIEVVAGAPLLQSASVEMSGRLSNAQIVELPTARRDFTQLLELQPGVVRTSTELLTINGLASNGISVTVDGVDAAGDTEVPSLSMFQGRNYINVISREAIEEVNVTKGVISAEVGRSFSGNVNVITKSGTNDLHGSLFEFLQNDVLNARYALLNANASKPPVRFNQFGGSLGGPIVRNKAFFFAAYEGYRQSNFTVITDDVPTPEFKARAVAAQPDYKATLDQYPAPTEAYEAGAASALFRGAVSDLAHDNHFVTRTDFYFSDLDRLSVRYTRGRPYRSIPRSLISNQRVYDYRTDSANVTWSHTATTWTSETRFGLNTNASQRLDELYNTGLPSVELRRHFGYGSELQQLEGHSYSIDEIVAKNSGRHTIKFGAIYMVRAPGRFNEEVPEFRFGSPDDMLANIPSRVRFTFGVPKFDARTWNIGAFVQDDFRIRPDLVLNLGVRYEYYSVFKDDQGRIVNPGSLDNAFASPTIFRDPDSIYDADRNNFLPRVGLVWSPDERTAVRSGLAVTVGPQSLRHFYTMVRYAPAIGFRTQFSGGLLDSLNLRYPMTNPQGIDFVLGLGLPSAYEIFDATNPNPYTVQWTFDIQRQLSETAVFQIGYVGTRGMKINLSHRYNQPDRVTGDHPVPGVLESLWRNASDSSTYHALQTAFRQRFARDITFNLNYTWSKTMAVAAGDYWGGNDPEVQDETNWAADWGPIPSDRTHRFSLDLIYNAPFDRWAGAQGGLQKLLGGWQLSGIWKATTGSALTLVQDSNFDADRPDYVGGDPYLRGGDKFQYLNPAAFAEVPEGGAGALVRPGNVGKGALRGPGFWNIDLSLSKAIEISERYDLQFRTELFNALNHPNLGSPRVDVTRGDFGRINSVSGARVIQMSLRLGF